MPVDDRDESVAQPARRRRWRTQFLRASHSAGGPTRSDPLSGACDRPCRDHPAFARRTFAAGPAGCTGSCRVLAITAASALELPALGVATTGEISAGMPTLQAPALRLRDVEAIFPLAAGCLLLAYIESVSAARAFAASTAIPLDPRQALLGTRRGQLRCASRSGLSGRRRPVAIRGQRQGRVAYAAGPGVRFDSASAVGLLFLTDLLRNLLEGRPCRRRPHGGVLPGGCAGAAAHVAYQPDRFLRGNVRTFRRAASWHPAREYCSRAGLGVDAAGPRLKPARGIPRPHPRTDRHSDLARHPDTEPLPDVLAFRPAASLIYVNAETVLETVIARLRATAPSVVRLVVCDLSASPHIDLAASSMLHRLHGELAARGIAFRIVGARGRGATCCGPMASMRRSEELDRIDTVDSPLANGRR